MGFYRKPLEEVVPQYAQIEYRSPDLYHTTAIDSINSSITVRQQNGQLTYVPTEQFALTASNTFTDNQIINADLYVDGDINTNTDYYINGNKQQNHSQFSTLHTLSGSAMTASVIPYDSVDLVYGISLLENSKIIIEHTGIYNFTFSAVGTTVINENTSFAIWFKKNGNDIPNSSTVLDIYKVSAGLGRVVMTVSYMIDLIKDDYIELWWMPYSVSTHIQYSPINTIPAVPSVILNVFQIR